MEKRFCLGIGILAVFLALGFLTTAWMDRANMAVVQDLDQAVTAVEDGDFFRGKKLALRAQETWQSAWRASAMAADHNPMDEIDGMFAQMEFYANTGAKKEFGACCARIGELVNAVADEHRLTWWNLL